MLSFYTRQEFEIVKFHKLNSDQILQFLDCPNFLVVARKEKVVQALKQIQKSRELNLFKRPEIVEAIKSIALDHSVLANMESQTYVASFIHAVAKMKIDDQTVWTSLASYVV